MTPITRLKALADEATQGVREFVCVKGTYVKSPNGAHIRSGDTLICRLPSEADKPIDQKQADGELIAACSPATIKKMIAVVEAARVLTHRLNEPWVEGSLCRQEAATADLQQALTALEQA